MSTRGGKQHQMIVEMERISAQQEDAKLLLSMTEEHTIQTYWNLMPNNGLTFSLSTNESIHL